MLQNIIQALNLSKVLDFTTVIKHELTFNIPTQYGHFIYLHPTRAEIVVFGGLTNTLAHTYSCLQ